MRKAEKQPEKQEREDTEDEKPVVVGDAEALPSQQRGKEMKSGGSLRFKGDDDATASSRFRESARERVLQAEREAFAVADESDAAQASGKVVFNAAVQKKRKHVDGTASSSKGVGVRVLMRAMGHRNISTTIGYIDASDDMLRKAVALV